MERLGVHCLTSIENDEKRKLGPRGPQWKKEWPFQGPWLEMRRLQVSTQTTEEDEKASKVVLDFSFYIGGVYHCRYFN